MTLTNQQKQIARWVLTGPRMPGMSLEVFDLPAVGAKRAEVSAKASAERKARPWWKIGDGRLRLMVGDEVITSELV